MSLAIKYENADDARMRLRHSVVLYNGDPVYIKEVRPPQGDEKGVLRVYADPIPLKAPGFGERGEEDAAMRKYISSKNFDIAPFKMGYVNAPKGCYYCSRLPNRVQKQGLSQDNFTAKDNRGNGLPFSVFIATPGVKDMVMNKYPPFRDAVAMLDKSKAVAFSREFAVERDDVLEDLVLIYHKGDKVGAVVDGRVTLGRKFKCLKESLEELGLKAA